MRCVYGVRQTANATDKTRLCSPRRHLCGQLTMLERERESERKTKVYERIADAYTAALEEIGDFSEEAFKHCQMSKTRHRPRLPSPWWHLPRCFEQPSLCRRDVDHEPPRCHCDRKVAKRRAFAAESARRQLHWDEKAAQAEQP